MDDVRIHLTAEVSVDAKIGPRDARTTSRCARGCASGRLHLGKNVYVDFGVTIGDNVKIQNNVSVYHGVSIEDGVVIDHILLLQ